MTWTAAAFLVLGFCAVAAWLQLEQRVQMVFRILNGALAVMRDKALDDRAKEKAMQRATARMLGTALLVMGILGLALALPLGVVWIADRAGWVSLDATIERTLEWEFLLVATVLGTALWILLRRRPAAGDSGADPSKVG